MPLDYGPDQRAQRSRRFEPISPTSVEVFRRIALDRQPCLATDDCVDDTCWAWYGTDPTLLHALVFHGHSIAVPRLACSAFVEPLTADRPLVLRRCDSANRGCWNPWHLFAGSLADAKARPADRRPTDPADSR